MRRLRAGVCGLVMTGIVCGPLLEGSAAGAAGGGDCQPKSPATRNGIVRSIDPRVCRVLSIARRARRKGDVPPVHGREWVVQQGINPNLARRARSIGGGRGMFVLPGRTNTCLYVGYRFGGFSCKPHVNLAQGKFQLIEINKRSFTVFQMVPDGATKVSFSIAGQRTRTLRVRGNAVYAKVNRRRGSGSMAWTDRSGRRFKREFTVTPL